MFVAECDARRLDIGATQDTELKTELDKELCVIDWRTRQRIRRGLLIEWFVVIMRVEVEQLGTTIAAVAGVLAHKRFTTTHTQQWLQILCHRDLH